MSEAAARRALAEAKRVVVKVGSALLANDPRAFLKIGGSVARVAAMDREVILVTSGGIALGLEPLGLTERPRELVALQAAAAAGQTRLMRRWTDVIEGGHGLGCAQVLLTHADLANRRRYLNARSALIHLIAKGMLPVVNENDTVSIEEIKLGDNDLLAAEIGGLVDADAVVLLTSADGLLTGDPAEGPAERVPYVDDVDAAERLTGKPSKLGTGGMGMKLRAAEVARSHGAACVIAPGGRQGCLEAVLAGHDVGTVMAPPVESSVSARKRWIAHTLRPQGSLIINEEAASGLRRNSSLLCAGVDEVVGRFTEGDCVEICIVGEERPFARGLVTVDADWARRVVGLRSAAARELLGELLPDELLPDELVHKDDHVLLE